jgi:hypothetical protein
MSLLLTWAEAVTAIVSMAAMANIVFFIPSCVYTAKYPFFGNFARKYLIYGQILVGFQGVCDEGQRH